MDNFLNAWISFSVNKWSGIQGFLNCLRHKGPIIASNNETRVVVVRPALDFWQNEPRQWIQRRVNQTVRSNGPNFFHPLDHFPYHHKLKYFIYTFNDDVQCFNVKKWQTYNLLTSKLSVTKTDTTQRNERIHRFLDQNNDLCLNSHVAEILTLLSKQLARDSVENLRWRLAVLTTLSTGFL